MITSILTHSKCRFMFIVLAQFGIIDTACISSMLGRCPPVVEPYMIIWSLATELVNRPKQKTDYEIQ